jgi:GntR family transcriptional regulator, transcriptional repressor for pyruvate dehydrogenase complex
MDETPPTRGRRGVKLSERIAQDIVSEISRAGMGPGDRLPAEVVMAQERGVSRGTLREALRILEIHGVIRLRPGPGGGPELVEPTSDSFSRMATLHFNRAGVTFRQLLDARLVLEPTMAELAALKRTPEQVLALRRNLREHARAEGAERLNHYAHEFHRIVADMAGNDNHVLSLMTTSLHGIFDIYARQGSGIEVMRQTVEVHGGIADAIEEADALHARESMEKHMQTSADTFAREHPTLIDANVEWLA